MRIAMVGTRGVPASYSGFETCVEEVGARLVERGHEVTVYCRSHHVRYDAPTYDTPGSPIRVPLFGNHFTFDPGHRIRLEVTLVDFPTFRPSNVASQASFGPPSLTLPTRQAGERTLQP